MNPQPTTTSTCSHGLYMFWYLDGCHLTLHCDALPCKYFLHSAWAPTPKLGHPSSFHGSFPYIPWTLTFLSYTDFQWDVPLISFVCQRLTAAGGSLTSNSLLQAILQCHPPQFSWIPSLHVGLPCLKILTPHNRSLSHKDIFLILLERWGIALICLRTLRPFHPPGALTACTW